MPVSTYCPACGKPCGVPDGFKSGTVRCPSCQSPFTFPVAETKTSKASSFVSPRATQYQFGLSVLLTPDAIPRNPFRANGNLPTVPKEVYDSGEPKNETVSRAGRRNSRW